MPALIDGLYTAAELGATPSTTKTILRTTTKTILRRKRIDLYIPTPPAFQNDVYEQVSGSLGSLTVGGNTLSFSFGGNYTITIPKTGTAVIGTGTANTIPYWSDANTMAASNLAMSGSNVLTLAASATATATVPYTGTLAMPKCIALTPSASISMNLNLGTLFTLTPDQSCAITPSNGNAGQAYYLIITTSGTNSYTITFSSPFKVTGTLATGTATGKVFVMAFAYCGTNVNEISRTTAM